MPITFSTVITYLNAIADKAAANGNDASDAGHGRFWVGLTRDQFVKNENPAGSGLVPNNSCKGADIPIVDTTNPLQSPFYLALTGANGFCSKGQMPKGGPVITDKDYSITLADGTVVPGSTIVDDLKWWLTNNMPE